MPHQINQYEESIWIVDWENSSMNDIQNIPKSNKTASNLYQIIGYHSIYGPNSLLYLGETNKIKRRFNEHSWWLKEMEDIKIKVGSIFPFESWKKHAENKDNYHPEICKETIGKIEKLLIFDSAPTFNCTNIASPGKLRKSIGNEDIRVFNTGKLAPLPHEVSSRYWLLK